MTFKPQHTSCFFVKYPNHQNNVKLGPRKIETLWNLFVTSTILISPFDVRGSVHKAKLRNPTHITAHFMTLCYTLLYQVYQIKS